MIIYASRTHSQLKQVVRELRSTKYKPEMVVLGSRDQLCVNPKFSKQKGSALNRACNVACTAHSCTFKNNLDKNVSAPGSASSNWLATGVDKIMDIEDMTIKAKKEQIWYVCCTVTQLVDPVDAVVCLSVCLFVCMYISLSLFLYCLSLNTNTYTSTA